MTIPAGPVQPVEELVLSAERVRTGTRRAPRERVRLRREVLTEEVTVTVTVRREVLLVVREPFGDLAQGDEAAGQVPGAERMPLEVVLSQERPVVSLEVAPYERVRVGVREVPGSTWVDTSRSREVLQPPVVQGETGPG